MGSLSDSIRDCVFYGILDTAYVPRARLLSKCRQLIASGTKLVQLRAKGEDERQRREIALEILPLFRDNAHCNLIINDDIRLAEEICSVIPNSGLHIGQDDGDPKLARKAIGKKRILGLSTHSIEQAKAADGLSEILDYFAVGPIFATNTKPGRKAVGLGLLRSVRAMNPLLPWFAIGGVNTKTASEVRLAGAERIVAVSDVLIPEDTTKAIDSLKRIFLEADPKA